MAPSATASKASTKASAKAPAKNSKSARIAAPGSRRHNEGHGRRLTAAFEALEAFPALAESRNRLLTTVREDGSSVSDVVEVVESDVALVIAVLRIANRARSPKRGKIATIPKAVEILTPGGVEALASRTATFDFFERTPVWDVMPERFRLHAVATQAAADRLAREMEYEDRDQLLVSALLAAPLAGCLSEPATASADAPSGGQPSPHPTSSTLRAARPRKYSATPMTIRAFRAMTAGVTTRERGLRYQRSKYARS